MPKADLFLTSITTSRDLSYPPFSSNLAISLPCPSISLCHFVTPPPRTDRDTHRLLEFLTLLVSTAQDLAPFLLFYHISFFLFGSLPCSLPTIPRAHLAISKTHYVSLDSRSFLLACSSAWTLYLPIYTWITSYPLQLYFKCNLTMITNPRCFL